MLSGDMKPAHSWENLLLIIETALKSTRTTLVKAFCEGIDNPTQKDHPIPLLQVMLFEALWNKWSGTNLATFASMTDLEKHFEGLSSGLERHIASFESKAETQNIIKAARLQDPISRDKKLILRDVFNYYHNLMRIKYLVMQLNMQISSEKCLDGVGFLEKISAINRNQLKGISENLQSNRHRFLNPLVNFNVMLVDLMKEKQYDDFIIPDLYTQDESPAEDHVFLPLLARINELPTIETLVGLIKREKPADPNTLTLPEYADKIQNERAFLRQFMDVIVSENIKQRKTFANHCTALLEIRNNAKSLDEFRVLFTELRDLKQIYEGKGLYNSASDFIEHTKKFSAALIGNAWNVARDTLKDNTDNVNLEIVSLVNDYAPSFTRFLVVQNEFDSTDEQLTDVAKFLKDWRIVYTQSNVIVDKAVDTLGEVAGRLKLHSTSLYQNAINHLKYHLPIYIAAPIVGVTAGALIGFLVFATATALMAPLMIGLGLLLGVGAAVFLALIREEIKPPPKPATPQLPPIERLNHIDIEQAKQKLFGSVVDPAVRVENSEPVATDDATNANQGSAATGGWLNPIGTFIDLLPKPKLSSITSLPGISHLTALPSVFFKGASATTDNANNSPDIRPK